MAPPEKKQKTEEAPAEETKADEAEKTEEPKAEEKKAPEPPKELEEDAPACSKPKVKDELTFHTSDTTMNVLQSTGTNVLMSLSEGGIQHFLAGARANVGITKGRYLFEVKIVQVVNTAELQANSRARPALVRLGFSTASSELLLGEGTANICFESEGCHIHNKERTRGAERFGRDNIVSVLLNLDKDSPNFNTVSLFKDGKRASQPVPLPDSLKGKALYPHVTFKHASLHVNFGPNPFAPLPFKCRTVKDATATDVTVAKVSEPESGKYDVVFPVGLPDEGSFDWLDLFLEKEKAKNFVELSDRKILEWAEKSGIWKPKGYAITGSNDKPDMYFQVRELDDGTARKALHMVAPLQKRNYIVMEVRGNLVAEERKEFVSKFSTANFKTTAMVMVGDPTTEFKKRSQQLILSDKQAASDKAFEAKKMEAKRKAELEKRQKAMAKAKKLEEKKRKKALEAAKKAAEEKAKAAAAAKAGEEKKEEEKKEEEKKEEEKEEEESEEEAEEEAAEEPMDEDPPKVELTDEEKKQVFRSRPCKDLTDFVFSTSFTKFSLPEADEGFGEIKYEWTKTASKAKSFLTEYKLDRKLNTRIEDLSPGAWFLAEHKKWQVALQSWQTKLNEYKAAKAKKAAAKAAKEAKKAKAAAEKEAKEKKAAEEKEKAEKEGKKEGEEEKKEEEKKEEPAVEVEEEEEEKEEEEVVVDFDGLDIFGLDDVNDVGGGMPLCINFDQVDWAMLSLRFELHLLAHAFRRDVNDEERPGMLVDHLTFYYSKYYKKQLREKDYGRESAKDLLELVNDTMHIADKNVAVSQLDDEMESFQIFLKLTEEARRHRLLRIDLGEEGAVLKVSGGATGEWKWQQKGGQQNWKGAENWKGAQQQQWQGKGGFQPQGKSGAGFQPYGNKGASKGGGKGKWGQQAKGGYGKW